VRVLRERSSSTVTTGSTHENRANLAERFFANVVEPLEGTRLGRQEIKGEVLEETEGALVTPDMIDAGRIPVAALPELVRVVVGVDPSGTKHGDAQGIVVKAKGIDGHGYTLADRTCNLSPEGWGRRAVAAADEFDADCLVVETNYGGDMCEAVIRAINPRIRIKKVHASRGKHVRFEPLGARYERGEEHHVGDFPELEDEVCAFTPDGYDGDESPNRADAAVWASTELFPVRSGLSPRDLYGEEGATA
jgi:phage terminase large subunit-like protein